jgi:hypothetical protein
MRDTIQINSKQYMIFRVAISFIIATTLSSCFDFDLFPEKTVRYKGRIVEAFDTTKPVDSVLVQGCTQEFSLFPNWPTCDVETFTDINGNFNISFKADGLEGRGISYGKDGYSNLDSCKKLPNGALECYLQPLPTIFYIFSPSKNNTPFIYDSLVVQLYLETKDTIIHYVTRSNPNTSGGTYYYWTSDPNSNNQTWNKSYTNIKVLDNSSVSIKANYFKDNNEMKVDSVTLFCPKGIGASYKIHDY